MEHVEIEADPIPDPGFVEREMPAAKADTVGEVAVDPNRPEWLPQKFNTAEDLAKAYGELEARQSTSIPNANPAQIAAPGEAPKAPEFDMAKYTREVIATGAISDESRAEIVKAGVPEGMIDTHIQGLSAIRDRQVDKLNGIAGGAEQFQAMSTWATNNLGAAEIEAFNAAIQSGDAAQTELAMRGLAAMYNGSTAGQREQLEGKTGGPSVAKFQNNAQVRAAMKDERYEHDPDYRAEVMARMR